MRCRVAACSVVALLAAAPASGQARPGWFDLPVQGGGTTLAALGITANERALTLSLVARALHDRETQFAKSPRLITEIVNLTATPAVGSDTGRESIDIPVPLDADTWRQLLELPSDADLFSRFLTDHSALLLAAGLTATDESIRLLVMRDRDLLRFLYSEGAAAFHIAARSLAVREGRVAAPGAAEGPAIWEALVGVAPNRVAQFLRALLTRDQGRLAWYYDTIATLDENRLAAAWPASADGRLASARALYGVFRDADPQWRANEQPLRRSFADPWTVVSLTEVVGGQLTGPRPAALWRLLFESDAVDPEDARRPLTVDPTPVTLPWLAHATVLRPPRERRQRFEMVRLAQRVFPAAEAADLPAIAVAVSGYKRFPSLLLALERMQIADATTWSVVVQAAQHVSDEADPRVESLASFQAAIAIVERLRHVRVIEVGTAGQVLRDLSASVRKDRKVAASIVRWLVDVCLPALPPLERPDAFTGKTAYESRLLQALAGRPDRVVRSIEWEGLTYAVDLVAAEHARLRAVRLALPSPGLDIAMAAQRPRELAAALTAIVYSVSLGHADGAAALSRDVATRHDFGLHSTTLLQQVTPWALPEERHGGGPWHVTGSLIGLDTGLARLRLRRVADEQMPQAPVLTLNDFATLARTIAALVPTDLHDADRDALAAAIQRGRQKVFDARGNPEALVALGRTVKMSATARHVLPWLVAHDPDAIIGCFSLRDLLWLGEPTVAAGVLDRWGVAGQALDGRQVTVMPPPAPWEDFAGRADAGQMTTQVPDMTLRLVEETARLRLPAPLVPSLLAYAVEDFWHDTQARFADDWPRMIRQAAAIDPSRVEDYVAALVGDGVLRAQ